MNARTRGFIGQYFDTPMRWGEDDCSLILADWWQENHGTDPASHLRGTYSTEAQKQAIIDDAGGLVALVSGLASAVGATERTGDCQEGDFGVIAPGIGAIFTGTYWACRSAKGIGFVRNPTIWRAWKI